MTKKSIIKNIPDEIKIVSKDEPVIAEYINEYTGENWYATNKRVIRHKKDKFMERVAELPYKHITSMTYYDQLVFDKVILGTLMLIFGSIILMFVYSSWGNTDSVIISLKQFLFYIGCFTLIIGFISVFLTEKEIGYKFTGSEISKDDWDISIKHYLLQQVKIKGIEDFVSVIRKHIK